jgi:electron transfer flavoprotein beta subunit
MGADRAIHIETDQPLDPIAQAEVLADAIRGESADLVFVGGQEADWDSSALGPAVAEALGWPHSDWTTELELQNGQARVRHDTDQGSATLDLPLPAVITTQQGLNEPRYPTLPNIMKAKRKELAKRSLAESGAPAPRVEVVAQEIQTRERRNEILGGAPADAARELVRKLHDEAKAL